MFITKEYCSKKTFYFFVLFVNVFWEYIYHIQEKKFGALFNAGWLVYRVLSCSLVGQNQVVPYVQEVVTLQKKYSNIFASEN